MLGVREGAMLGFTNVGFADGREELGGFEGVVLDGVIDGSAVVGDNEGCCDGFVGVGNFVGLVGDTLGSSDGKALGCIEGKTLGLAVGMTDFNINAATSFQASGAVDELGCQSHPRKDTKPFPTTARNTRQQPPVA